ncbi:class I SAM-dependent methyltransferase [Thermococcus sp.]
MDALIKKLDKNIFAMVRISMLHLLQLGLKYGIFAKLASPQSQDDIITSVPVGNKTLLRNLINTYVKMGIIKESGGRLILDEFSYTLNISPENIPYITPGWVSIFEEIYRMVDYASITPEHPKVLMDFDKDADFWDMRLSLEFNSLYREIIVKAGGLKDEMKVLDLGCGSVSPVEIGQHVGPNGEYVGVDFSPGILSIAESRIRSSGMDWVTLRELDIRKIIPKRRYDAVIMSFILEYVDSINRVVKTAMDALESGGKLIIVEPFRENYPNICAWEFFERLTKDFVGFPSRSAVLNALEASGEEFRIKELGSSVLLITKM